MRAAVMTEVGAPLALEELDVAEPGPYEVVVRIKASGICHTDVSVLNGSSPFTVHTPLVLGHEGAGFVEAVGSGVRGLSVGDRVVATGINPCGKCHWCVNDEDVQCAAADHSAARAPRLHRGDGTGAGALVGLGTFAEQMILPEGKLVRIESDIPDEQLALIGCGVSTGVGAVLNTARVKPGSSVAVFGGGGVGQSIVQGARIAGAARIVLVDPIALKREAALRLGATDVVDPGADDPVLAVRELTGGRGADYAFEAAGLYETAGHTFQATRRGGVVVIVGGMPADVPPPWSLREHHLSARSVIGSMGGSARPARDFPLYVELAETGRLDLASLVSRRIRLDEVADGLRAIEAGEVIRSVIIN